MHSSITHSTTGRVSRRGQREALASRQLSSVTPCLHTAISPVDTGR
ncbi:MAG TPA: hypothetical protein VF572_05820 [Candidatus Saccharimonadales bacterium]|jgi:hypothetical protein